MVKHTHMCMYIFVKSYGGTVVKCHSIFPLGALSTFCERQQSSIPKYVLFMASVSLIYADMRFDMAV